MRQKNCGSKLTQNIGEKKQLSTNAKEMNKKIEHDNKNIHGSLLILRKTITVDDADKGNAKIPVKKPIYAAERRTAITMKPESLKLPPRSKITHRQEIFPLFRILTIIIKYTAREF